MLYAHFEPGVNSSGAAPKTGQKSDNVRAPASAVQNGGSRNTSGIPEDIVSSWWTVTCDFAGPSGKSGSSEPMVASSLTRFCSTSCATRTAVNILLTDPSANVVSGVLALDASRSARPYARSTIDRPWRVSSTTPEN